MKEIARGVFLEEYEKKRAELEKRMHEIAYRAYEQAIDDLLRAMQYDIRSVTRIGIDGCREIFEGEKAQKYISDQIAKQIKKNLEDKHFRV